MRSLVGLAAILVAALSITTRAEAQYRPPRIIIRPQPAPPPNPSGKRYVEMNYPSPEKRAANLAGLLDLTDEQRNKVKDIFVLQEKESSALWDDQSVEPHERLKKLDEVRIAAVRKVRDVLTDEQKKKYDALDPASKPAEKPRLQPDPNSGPLV